MNKKLLTDTQNKQMNKVFDSWFEQLQKRYFYLFQTTYGYVWGIEEIHIKRTKLFEYKYDFTSGIIAHKINFELETKKTILDNPEVKTIREKLKLYKEWAFTTGIRRTTPVEWPLPQTGAIFTLEEMERLKIHLLMIIIGEEKDEREHLNIFMLPWYYSRRLQEILDKSTTREEAESLFNELRATTNIYKVMRKEEADKLHETFNKWLNTERKPWEV